MDTLMLFIALLCVPMATALLYFIRKSFSPT